jgi:hypothetical protein
MVHLFSITILRKDDSSFVTLASVEDLSTVNFFQRSAIDEFMISFSKTIAEKTQEGQRQAVKENST